MTVAPSCHVPSPPPIQRGSTPAWKLLLTLAVAGAAAGWLIVTVYNATLPAIQKHAAHEESAAVREVLEAPARWDTLYLIGNAVTATPPAGTDKRDAQKAFVGFDAGGRRIGVAVTAAEPGFQELLTLMIGFDPATGTLTGYKVLDQQETPGLGDRVESDTSFGNQFAGRVAPLKPVKQRTADDPSAVQTITGATISSRAVIRIINDAVARWRPLIQAYDRGGQQ
jgi:H+/Na+-translocating ferredoxin:NAD+ oxidoreductase subunit G